ncbi:hypothetical protein EV426DRAFT_534547 [Tirmania nivea]|nr:hypothetical protein EV426DRAFT_534547 [Tirmania nivea]
MGHNKCSGRWQAGKPQQEYEGTGSGSDKTKKLKELPLMDWTQPDFEPLPQYSAKHFESLRAIDWSKTSLGHPSTWDACLVSMAATTMTNPYPTAVYWGADHTMFYNEHFVAIAQNRNPYVLGKTFASAWPELTSYFIPILDKAYYGGETTIEHEKLVPIVGRVSGVSEEEAYFNFIICPVIGADGRPVGVIQQAFEVTHDVISTRRMGFLRHLGEILDFNVAGDFLKKVFQAFETTPDVGVWNDTPFMSLYGLDDPVTGQCTLVGSMGLPARLAPEICLLFEGTPRTKPHNLFKAAMKEAMGKGETVLMRLGNEDITKIKSRGKGNVRPYAIVIPIQTTKGLIRGFLALGVNPRRPFDDDYRFWVGLLKTELQSALGREELLKPEIHKGIYAEIQRTEHMRTLEVQKLLKDCTEELRESELLFAKITEAIAVGLALVGINGDLSFTNNAFHELTTLPRNKDNRGNLNWRDMVYHEDRERVYKLFDEVIAKGCASWWEARTGQNYPERGWKYWVSCNMTVQRNDQTGKLIGYMLTIMDITQVKLAEEYQRELSVQAVKKRRQQENFIDIFSHELRNPFCATLQCADGILAGVTEYQLKGGHLDIEDIADAASTILVCVQHQMRIINDVLTLSKLDSMLLSVVPVDVQIHESIFTTLKIFQSELQVKGIKTIFIIGDSYENIALDWLKCDPSRFNQILVNLLTNAIKFTSLQCGRREITVILDACSEQPLRFGNVVYTSTKPSIEGEGWGNGEPVYLHVKVQDTGIGINEYWQKKLFKRFEQVPKTHVTYGGSGLGLFICRKLCRLQGGRIGVYSEEGKGSEFAFYIRVRRSVPPSGRPRNVEPFTPHASTSPAMQSSLKAFKPLKSPSIQPHPATSENTHSYRVLIVEDNLINQAVLHRQLRKRGCITHVANNGQEALEFVQESEFGQEGGTEIDVVLMDMEMPVMDGNTTTRIIRQAEAEGRLRRHVPILGISANARIEQVAEMTKAGMDDAISKPFRVADLVVKLSKLIERSGVAGVPRTPDGSSGTKDEYNAPTTPPPLPPQAVGSGPPIFNPGNIASENNFLNSNQETPPIPSISPSDSPMTPLPAPLLLKINPNEELMGELPSPVESPISETLGFAL